LNARAALRSLTVTPGWSALIRPITNSTTDDSSWRDLSLSAPPGDVRVQRGADDPRRRNRVPADRAPGRPRPGEGLGDKVLRRIPVTDAHQHGAETVVLGRAVNPAKSIGRAPTPVQRAEAARRFHGRRLLVLLLQFGLGLCDLRLCRAWERAAKRADQHGGSLHVVCAALTPLAVPLFVKARHATVSGRDL